MANYIDFQMVQCYTECEYQINAYIAMHTLLCFVDDERRRRPGARVFTEDEFSKIMFKIEQENLAEGLWSELIKIRTKNKNWNYLHAFCEANGMDWLNGVSDLRKQFRDRRFRLRKRLNKAKETGQGSQPDLPAEYNRLYSALKNVRGISHGREVSTYLT